jgi:hypothetical protein
MQTLCLAYILQEETAMDKFTKVMLFASVVGAIGAAGMNYKNGKEVPLAEDRQEYKLEKMWAGDEELFCYGGVFNHLELEKSFLAWADSTGRYIADVYYIGDHYSDPRLMIVHYEDTNEVVQVVLTASYEYRSTHVA